MKYYENLEEAMCRELEMLDKKYGSDSGEMTAQDVEKVDKLYHALKCAATYHAMKESEGWEEKDASGRSYRRGRDSMGRFTSREGGSSREQGGSYGYSGYPGGSGYPGYSGYSGYPGPERWYSREGTQYYP